MATELNHASGQTPRVTCAECGSAIVPGSSRMAGLCTECAHWLYGYPACTHSFADGVCKCCGWNGVTSAHVARLKSGDQ